MNCVVKLSADACEIWNGEQFQSIDQPEVAAVLGIRPEQVKLNMLFAGGSFGRRANPHADYVVEAVQIAKAHAEKSGGRVPVKLVWTREDDMRAGSYRPMYYHALKAGLDAQGNIIAWQHRIVGQSILGGTVFEGMMVKDGIDATSVEGAANLPYAVPNLGVDLHSPRTGVPVQWWRSVGSTHTAFSTETFLDELALAAGKDPYQVRRALLAKSPRHKTVLEMAATESDWTTPLVSARVGERRGRGIAVHESFNTVVAQVAEVTVRRDGSWRVDRVMCAVDCGVAVNPDVIRAQMEAASHTASPRRCTARSRSRTEWSNSRTSTIHAAAHERDAADRRVHRALDREAPPGWANPPRRSSHRRSRTPCSRRRESRFASLPIRIQA